MRKIRLQDRLDSLLNKPAFKKMDKDLKIYNRELEVNRYYLNKVLAKVPKTPAVKAPKIGKASSIKATPTVASPISGAAVKAAPSVGKTPGKSAASAKTIRIPSLGGR